MALRTKSGFLYGYTVSSDNRYIDFKTTSGGPQITATLRLGKYGLSELLQQIEDALEAADPLNSFVVTVDRTVAGGTQNRITIATSTATYFDILFGTGTNALQSAASLLGFAATDRTGSLTYTGTASTGTYMYPTNIGYTYQPIETFKRAQGVVNISSSGAKEVLTFSVNEFFQVEFKYEPEAKAVVEWQAFMSWAISQAEVEFFKDIAAPTDFVRVTLEKTDVDGKGLGWTMREMLPDFPFFYRTGILQFRKVVT
jgi:hypothetical protein